MADEKKREKKNKLKAITPELLTSAHRIGRSTAEPKYAGIRKNIPGGTIMFHPPKKTPHIHMETQKRGHENKFPGGKRL